MHPAILPAAGRPAAMGQLFPACTGMSGYSRRGREASGPPLVISKYSPASARTSSSAPLCPPAPPALGREFRFQKAMMALALAEIPPIAQGRGHLAEEFTPIPQCHRASSQALIPQYFTDQKSTPSFPRAIVKAVGRLLEFPANSACMRMLNRIDRLLARSSCSGRSWRDLNPTRIRPLCTA